ncbi:MAG TPA: DUF1328 domain-containing protein [Tepidisphaeraceae bacterium]|nr:DUF1328 domain-containing protein [Tepidisphaeraceae bacterium]
MLHWSAVFLGVSTLAAIVGLSGVDGTAATLARMLFAVSAALFVVCVFVSAARKG